MVAYAEDTKGDEIYTIYVIDAETQATIGEPLVGVTSYLEWAGDNAFVYITMDEILRPDKVGNTPLDSVLTYLVLMILLFSTAAATTKTFPPLLQQDHLSHDSC